MLQKDANGCPYLILAPMEGVGDRTFRRAIASIGGFDEAVKDFLSVPVNAHVKSLSKAYIFDEIAPFPLAAQIMGCDPHLMQAMAREVEKRGAPRIDINCGCPSNTVTGHGAGSSLLKNTDLLYRIVSSVVSSVSIPVTVKLRSGYKDNALFKENLLAIQEAKVKYITLHPRTKTDGYRASAKWELIAEAKSLLKIPVVGNGDIFTLQDGLKMLNSTGCDGLMIGRGAIIDPFIFHRIRANFAGRRYERKWSDFSLFLEVYLKELPPNMTNRTRINKVKQLLSFLFQQTPMLIENRDKILRSHPPSCRALLDIALPLLQNFSMV